MLLSALRFWGGGGDIGRVAFRFAGGGDAGMVRACEDDARSCLHGAFVAKAGLILRKLWKKLVVECGCSLILMQLCMARHLPLCSQD